MRKEVLPKAISQVLADFKAGEMVVGLKRAPEEGVKKFKANKLPNLV